MENQAQNELMKVIDSNGLESQTSNNIKEQFLPLFEQAENWKKKAIDLVVTDITQVAEMKMARTARLALKDIRVNADKTRKALKEDSLRYGKAVQGVYNVLEYLIVPIEKHLEEQEKFVEIQESKRKAELKEVREIELKPFAEFVPFMMDLGEITEEDFQKVLNGAKLQLSQKLEQELKEEQERQAKLKAEAEERERVRLENEKLKAEAAEKEKQLAEERAKAEAERKAIEEKARKEREIAEAKAKKEREEIERKAAEEKAKREAAEEEIRIRDKAIREKMEAEERLQKQKEAEEKKAAKAPIKQQLNKWVDSFSLGKPLSENDTTIEIEKKFESFREWAKQQIEKI